MTAAHDHAPWTVPPVVVTVDGGPAGRDVLESGARFAALTGAPLLALHIRTRPSLMEEFFIRSSLSGWAGSQPEWRDELERDAWLDCISVLGPTALTWRFALAHGEVVAAVRQFSDQVGAAAVFLGTRPTGRMHRCPALTLARAHDCPVHLVHHS